MRDGSCPRLGWRRLVLACLPVFAAAAAQAAPPDRPPVSVHAGLKQLHFSWPSMPGATRYELWFLPAVGATWVKYAQLPPSRTSVAVNIAAHFLQWNQARYVLKACNAEGCGRTPHLFVSHLMQQTVGYFTRPAAPNRYRLGSDVEIGEWGNTLAASFLKDDGRSAGVAVYRKSGTAWSFEAELLADPPHPDTIRGVDPSVTVSANGDVIALGVAIALVRDEDPLGEVDPGAVYVFRRTAAGWVREQKLTFPNSFLEEKFGRHVELDESGTLLAVWRRFEDPPGQPPGPWARQGFVELFRYSNGAWTRAAPISTFGCLSMGLSGDGKTLVRGCGNTVEVLKAPDWQRVASLPNQVDSMVYSPLPREIAVNYDGTSFALRSVTWNEDYSVLRATVNVYHLGASGWAREATLEPGEWSHDGNEDPNEGFGGNIAMSRDGRFVAVGAPGDRLPGHGAVYPPFVGSPGSYYGHGAVYVFERKSAGWKRRQVIRPNEGGITWEDLGALNGGVSFARNGKDLAVGGGGDPGAAVVIGGPAPEPARQFLGAIWLY